MMKVAGIILAGGASKRYKGNKLLSEHYTGEPLVSYCAEQMATIPLAYRYLISGRWHNEIMAALAESSSFSKAPDSADIACEVAVAFNPHWQEGMASSLRYGLAHALAIDSNITHLMVSLADLAKVTHRHLHTLLQASQANPDKLICSYWHSNNNSRYTVPAIFPAAAFPSLLALTGDSGAKSVIKQWRGEGKVTHINLPEAAFDIDVPLDWER